MIEADTGSHRPFRVVWFATKIPSRKVWRWSRPELKRLRYQGSRRSYSRQLKRPLRDLADGGRPSVRPAIINGPRFFMATPHETRKYIAQFGCHT